MEIYYRSLLPAGKILSFDINLWNGGEGDIVLEWGLDPPIDKDNSPPHTTWNSGFDHFQLFITMTGISNNSVKLLMTLNSEVSRV